MNKTPKPTDNYRFCNHHHELTEDHELVNFETTGPFVANKKAIPLLKALADLGLVTRTHHIDENGGFFSIIIKDNVNIDVRTVFERDAGRTKYNGKVEIMIGWINGRDHSKEIKS